MWLPSLFRFKGTVIPIIWRSVLVISGWTSVLVSIHNLTSFKISHFQPFVSVLGGIIGLLLAFRTNTAYDRYWEGRKIWSTMTTHIRTLTRCFWVMVEEKGYSSQDVVEKVTAINLLVAFAYATRNYLREEYSYDEDRLREVIFHIPRFSQFSVPSHNQSPKDEVAKRKSSLLEKVRLFISRYLFSSENFFSRSNNDKVVTAVPTNIPIELSYYIASYINRLQKKQLIAHSSFTMMNNALTGMVDCVGGFERILRTPIPRAYSTHLTHVTWTFLLALPTLFVDRLSWVTIPATAVISFVALGILGIGLEIENPFGYDDNDLPLDDYCKAIYKESLQIIGHQIPNPELWLLSDKNHPLAWESNLSATDLVRMCQTKVRRVLAAGSQISPLTKNLDLTGNPENTEKTGHLPFLVKRGNSATKLENEAVLQPVTAKT